MIIQTAARSYRAAELRRVIGVGVFQVCCVCVCMCGVIVNGENSCGNERILLEPDGRIGILFIPRMASADSGSSVRDSTNNFLLVI